MSDCLFCAIVAGRAERSLVFADERAIAFMDIQPINRGHLLVVPTRHAESLADLEDGEVEHVSAVARRCAAPLRRSGLRCEGVNLFLADGEAAGQEVFHVHLHVLPRFRGDGFGLRIESEYIVRPRDELDVAAATLRDAWP